MPLPFSLLNGEEPIRTTENTQRSEFAKRGRIYVVDKKNCVGSSWYADPLPSLGYHLNVLLIQ